MPKETFTVDVEYTDTFGGQANYSWVRRETLTLPVGLSDAAIMRRAKRAMGITGMRGRSFANGDYWEFRPYRHLTVMHVYACY